MQAHVPPSTLPELSFVVGAPPLFEVAPAWVNDAQENRAAVSLAEWDSIEAAQTVREEAKVLIRSLNQQLANDSPLTLPIAIGPVVWETATDTERGSRRSAFVEVNAAAIAVSSAEAVALVDGKEIAPPPSRGVRAGRLRKRNPTFAEAENLFLKAGSDIRQLWLPFEHIKKRSGHDPERLIEKNDVRAFGETANNRPNVRHIGDGRPHQYRQLSDDEAREVVQRLLNAWLDAEEPR